MRESEKTPPASWPETNSKPLILRETAETRLGSFVTVRDAKSHLSSLLDWVSGGREVTITSDGRPKARLVPVEEKPQRKIFKGMGDFLLSQPVHGGPGTEQLVREDRDARGW